MASSSNNHQIVSELLQELTSMSEMNEDGITPVMQSAQRCSEEALKLLDDKDEDGEGLEVQVGC